MQTGADYQARVAAWFATQCLAERDIKDTLGLKTSFIPLFIQGESRAHIDDLVVQSRDGETAYCQAKHSISLSEQEDSDLWKTATQFVLQYRAGHSLNIGRSFDQTKDRFLIVTSSRSPDTIIKDLRVALNKLEGIGVGAQRVPILTKREDECLAKFEQVLHAAGSEIGMNGSDIDNTLRMSRVLVLDLDDGDTDEKAACDLLALGILRNADQAKAAFSVLFKESVNFAKKGTGGNFADIQRVLLNNRLVIKSVPSFQADIQKLSNYSNAALESIRVHSEIEFRGNKVRIERDVRDAIWQMSQAGSFLIIGEPGSGKSGELYQLAIKLGASKHDVVCLTVDSMDVSSGHGLKADVGGLEHELVDVLSTWPGALPAFLVIDSLDSARSETAQTIIRKLIKDVIDKCPRWRVVASVRKFDLKYGADFDELFRGTAPTSFIDSDFTNVVHVNVPLLSDSEIDQLNDIEPALLKAINALNDDTLQLLRNIFNLRLFAEVFEEDEQLPDGQPIRTQIELLEKYWHKRVCNQGTATRHKRELALRRIASSMIDRHSLTANRIDSIDASLAEALEDLLRIHLLRYPRRPDNSRDDERFIIFAHHVFFDFAVSKVWLSADSLTLVNQLSHRPELQLLLRPSIILYFNALWSLSGPKREEFWSVAQSVAKATDIPALSKTVGPLVAAQNATVIDDFRSLLCAIQSADSTGAVALDQLFKYVVRAALSLGAEELRKKANLWLSVAREVSTVNRMGISYDVAYLLRTIVID